MFSWRPGDGRAGEYVHVVWRVPLIHLDRDDNKALELQTESLNDISIYHTRVKKATLFASDVHQSDIDSKAVACVMYNKLPGDNLPRDRWKVNDNAIRVVEMALTTQDFDIIHDLRELNGRPKDASFDVFWSAIKSLLESHACVDDRQHGEIFYQYAPCDRNLKVHMFPKFLLLI